MPDDPVIAALASTVKRSLPSGSSICVSAMRDVLGANAANAAWIKQNFSSLVEEVQQAAYKLYLEAEKPAVAAALRSVLGALLPPDATSDDLFLLIEKHFQALDRLFLGLTQGRRARAGNAFEHVIRELFTVLGYPYTSQAIINGQPDFLLPSEGHFRRNPMDCIIFTVKRSLRERWRQIVTEGTRGFLFFLATIDEQITPRDLGEMMQNRIYLVMPSRIKDKFYPDQANVISFEMFFAQHLDPAMARWRANNVVR